MRKPKPLSDEQRLNNEVEAHPSKNVKRLHEIAETIAALSEDLESDLHPELIEMLAAAQSEVETVRNTMLTL